MVCERPGFAGQHEERRLIDIFGIFNMVDESSGKPINRRAMTGDELDKWTFFSRLGELAQKLSIASRTKSRVALPIWNDVAQPHVLRLGLF
jgi:hypothetical protein